MGQYCDRKGHLIKSTIILFLYKRMKAIPSANLALKLAPNDNYFIEELVGIS